MWMVAPVVIPMSWSGTSENSNRFRRMARATMASSIANWSPTHFLGPPLNGMYLKSVFTSVGMGPSRSKRSGMKASASSHTWYTTSTASQDSAVQTRVVKRLPSTIH